MASAGFAAGTSGFISTSNSTLGQIAGDQIGNANLVELPNGNVVINSPNWNGGFGAVSCLTPAEYQAGGFVISASNSLVGGGAADNVGNTTIEVLSNGNYVVRSTAWDNGATTNVGAVTWVNGSTCIPFGASGRGAVVSAANSMVGTTASDAVGTVVALTNGNYVVRAGNWDNGAAVNAGAVRWCNGSTGNCVGPITPSNATVGSTTTDQIGNPLLALSNGNYVFGGLGWDNGAATDAGFVRFCNGTTGCTGTINATNSIVGTASNDQVGYSFAPTELPSGHYIFSSPLWNGFLGAVTRCSISTGCTGNITSSNSLVGSTFGDQIGQTGYIELSNGNYLVISPSWNSARGAVTLCNGASGCTGTVNAGNSLVGSASGHAVGFNGVRETSGGGYIVSSDLWDGVATDVGAVTICPSSGCTGNVTAANSLTGTTANDGVGRNGFDVGPSGFLVVRSAVWDRTSPNLTDAGAMTFCNYTTNSCAGQTVSASNSVVGATANEGVGSAAVRYSPTGVAMLRSNGWDSGALVDAGAVRFCTPPACTGEFSAANSIVGTIASSNVAGVIPVVLANGNFLLRGSQWSNASGTNLGYVRICSGVTGCPAGTISSANALVGTANGDGVGGGATVNGNRILVRSSNWGGGRGALTVCDGATIGDCVGTVSASNSVVGNIAGDNVSSGTSLALSNGNFLASSPNWDNGFNANAGAVTYMTSSAPPTVDTPTSAAITVNSATLGGNVTSDNGAPINGRGIVLSPTATNNNPLIGGIGVTNIATSGTTGVFTLSAGSLTANTAYSFKAYATNSEGTGYSSVGTFTTLAPSLTINNVTVNEGNTGITNFMFTVSLSAPAGPGGVSFNIATANDTAAAGSDYVANSLSSQTIPAGISSYNFTVQVNGDTFNEANETFFVNVSSVTGATVGDGQGVGTITNDDPLPGFSINDVSVTEGNVGTTLAQFTVTLSAASGQTVAVSYATANGTAIAGADYASTIGTLNFSPGETTRPITVQVQGDAVVEANETYFVNLSGQVNATIIDNQGLGTIVDDDCPSTVVSSGGDSGAGTLRQVIADACAGSTVTFAPGVTTVTLTSAELVINKNLSIDGGASPVTVTRSAAGGTPQFRIFNVQSGNTVSMNALVVSNGNHPTQAGGIQNDGSLTLTNMHITGNRAPQSGGIQNNSVLNLSNSSVTNNVATLFGGGLAVFGASATTTLSNCTFTGNQAATDTGAIGAGGLSLAVTSCTIAGNTVLQPGGVGAGIIVNGVPTTLRNSIVVGNTEGNGAESNIDGTVQAASAFNVLGAGPSGGLTNGTNNNQVGVSNALLGSLGNYGGLTPTLPLLPGSVAINAGTNVSTPTSDQRGISRPRVGIVDVGAFESSGFFLDILAGPGQSAAVGTAFAFPLIVGVVPMNSVEPTQGGRLTYTAPGAGASAILSTSTPIIDGGQAIVSATANTTIGSYVVTATGRGNASSAASFTLQNIGPGLSISDVTQSEGTGGTSTFTFTVSLSSPAGVGGVSFDIGTANGTATSGSDYVASSLTGQSIAAGNSSRTFVVTVNGDTTFEANETFFVNVTSVTGASVTDGQGLGTINNDDVAPTLTINAPSVTEGNAGPTPLNFIVSLSEPSGLPVNFNFATGTGTAAVGTDYVAIGSTAGTIAPGGIGASVNVTIIGDTTPEPNETVVLNLTGITGATPASLTGTGTINDDDVTTVVIEDASLTEGNSGTQILIFNVDRSSSAGAFTVDFATSSGTATAGSDFTGATGTLTFPAGGPLRQTVVVTTIGDLSVEANETFNVTLSNLVNSTLTASITDNTGVGTINDNDSATVQFAPTSLSQSEATSPMAFTVTLSNPVQSGVTLTVNSTAGSATSPADFTAISGGTVTFAPNSTTAQTVNVVIANDSLFEGNETYTLALSGLVATGNVTLPPGTATATGTITNDDAAPTITISAPSVVEGNPPSNTPLNFVVSLNTASGLPVNFNYATNGAAGTATAGTDYTAIASTAGSIAAGQLSATLPVSVIGDLVSEGNETVVLDLSAISNADVTTLSGTGTINDDDVAQITINDVGLTEGDSGSQNLQFTVSRSGNGGTFSVDFATSNGTATAGSDYTSTTGTLNFTANGAPSQVINVPVTGESLVEATETFTLTLSNVVNTVGTAAINDGSGTGTITDNDSATVQFTPVDVSQSESTSPMAFTVTLSNPVQSGVTLTVNSTPGSATSPADFTAVSGGTVTFAPNSTTSQTVNVVIANDGLFEGNETYTLALSGLVATGNVTLPPGTATATGTITNDDAAPTITINAPSVVEGNPPSNTPLNFVVSLNTASGLPVNFNYATNGAAGTATAGTDYTAIASTAGSIAAGQLSVTLPVSVIGDLVSEGNETVVLDLSAISNADVTTLSGTGTINDDDVAQITINDVGLTEGDSGSQNLQFTVSRSGNGGTFSVDFATSNGTATAGSDYSSTTGTLNFTANGAPSQVINVPITGESLVEATETFTLTLSNVVNTVGTAAINDGSGTGTITDNDSATVQFAPTSLSQSEATSPMAFTVTLSNPVQSGVTLTVNSTPGTATSPADFTAISGGTVTFAPNSNTAQTVNVVINNDALDEDDEQYTLTLSGLTATGNVTLPAGTATATGTIQDEDATPTLSVSNPSQAEGNSGTAPMNFVVSLSAVSGRTVSFNRATQDGTALVANNDYQPLAGAPLTIPAGQTSVTIPVQIVGDSNAEGNESFTLQLTSIVNATPSTTFGTGTIQEDDRFPLAFTASTSPNPSSFQQPVTVTVVLNQPPQAPLPTGTIVVAGPLGNGCTINLPALSCTYTPTVVGPSTLNLSYAGDPGNFPANASTTHTVLRFADLSISKDDGRTVVNAGDVLTYTIVVRNDGPDTAINVQVEDLIPATLSNASWTCAGSACADASGTGSIQQTINLPSGQQLTYTLTATVASGAAQTIDNLARVSVTTAAPSYVLDPDTDDQIAIDINVNDLIFRNGWE